MNVLNDAHPALLTTWASAADPIHGRFSNLSECTSRRVRLGGLHALKLISALRGGGPSGHHLHQVRSVSRRSVNVADHSVLGER